MPDPVNRASREYGVDSGLRVRKVRTPLGVIAMIYEARPNVTIDAFALCFKAGNACLLKGGREASSSSRALASLARDPLAAHGAPADAITAVTTSDREEIKRMLAMEGTIDLVIPRGGETLIRFVHEHSRAKLGVQLGHAGRKGSTQRLWEETDRPLKDGNWPLLAASPIPVFAAQAQRALEKHRRGGATPSRARGVDPGHRASVRVTRPE